MKRVTSDPSPLMHPTKSRHCDPSLVTLKAKTRHYDLSYVTCLVKHVSDHHRHVLTRRVTNEKFYKKKGEQS